MADVDPSAWTWFYSGLNNVAAHGEQREADTRQRLERARTLIHGRFDESLDLEAIAREAYLSRFHFAREFRRHFDATPHQYLTRRRIERAKELLVGTEMSVTAICMAVGFSSLGSFSSLFQRHVGHSPNRYRRTLVQSLGVPSPLPPIPTCFLAHFGTRSATFEKRTG